MHAGIRLEHPFESPIEEELVRVLEKHLHESAIVTNQVEVPTPHGTFRLDFLVEVNGSKVGLEADGKDFHSYDRDMFRDSIILGYSDIHAIYRFRGKEILFYLNDSLFALSTLEPQLFSKRGLTNLDTLSLLNEGGGRVRVISELVIAQGEWLSPHAVSILHVSKDAHNPIWRRLSNFAKLHPGVSVDDLIELGDRQGLQWYRD